MRISNWSSDVCSSDLLCERGRLVRLARGLYHPADTEEIDAAHSFAAAARLAPHGIIALQYHGLTTQLPYAVWIGLHHAARIPRTLPFRIQAVRASGAAFAEGRATACARRRSEERRGGQEWDRRGRFRSAPSN